MLNSHKDFFVAGEAGNTGELVLLLKEHRPDILILDFNPSYFNDASLSQTLKEISDCKVIILSSQDKKWNIFKSLELNVYCYLTKECATGDIIRALQAASKGEKFFCSFIINVLMEQNTPGINEEGGHRPNCLTDREKEIVKLIAGGMINKEIAHELNLSPHTVHSHRKKIMKKLNVHSAVELSQYARENGLLQ